MPAPVVRPEDLLRATMEEYGVNEVELGLAEADDEEAELALLRRFLFAPPQRQLTSGERHGLRLDKVQRRLSALFTMWSGRKVRVGHSDPPCTDLDVIYLPKALPAPESPSEDLLIFKVAGLVQLGFSQFGLLQERRVLGELYRDWVLRSTFHLLATRYILARWVRLWPGLRAELDQLPYLEKAGVLRVNLTEVPRDGLPAAFIPLYHPQVVCLNWRDPGADGLPARDALAAVDRIGDVGAVPVLLGQAQRLREHFRRLRLGPPPLPLFAGILRPEWILADLARDFAAENEWKRGNKPLRQLMDAVARRGPIAAEPAPAEATKPGLRARLFAKLAGPTTASNAPAYGQLRDEANQAAKEVRYGAASWQPGTNPAALSDVVEKPVEDEGRSWDEWDDGAGVYVLDATKVFTPEAPTGPLGAYERIVEANQPQIKQIRRRFAALRVEERWVGGQPDGPETDLNRAILALTDIAAGHSPDDRIFRRYIRAKQSVSILTMVDLSGSTQGHVIHLEQTAIVLFAEGLRTLGFPHAFYGFGNTHPQDCQLCRLKGFDENYSENVYKRMANLRPNGATRLGAFIRHAAWLLDKRPESRRILMVISDGKPEDRGDYRGKKGIRDTAMAVAEARRLGVHVYCVSLDGEEGAARYLTEIFGAGRFLELPDPDALPARLPEVFRELVG